jgi:hypothetical protein
MRDVSDWLQRICVRRSVVFVASWMICAALFAAANALAENCQSGADLDDATRNALDVAAMHDFDLIAKGDTASLRQNAIPSLASDFSSIETAVQNDQAALAGAKATARPPFLLEAGGTAPLAHAEFYCGVFGASGQTQNSAVFYLNNLAPGKYGVVILDAATTKGAYTVSLILQQVGSDWKLGGLYIKAGQLAGHDSAWFVSRAQQFRSKGQLHNAWLYYLEARALVSPLPFMSTAATDKLYDDSQKMLPADFPADGKTADFSAGAGAGATMYKLIGAYPDPVGNDLDLVVKYQVADVSNTNRAYDGNVALMKALVAKYPELRDAFAAIVARAVDPSGKDYGTLLAVKDIK